MLDNFTKEICDSMGLKYILETNVLHVDNIVPITKNILVIRTFLFPKPESLSESFSGTYYYLNGGKIKKIEAKWFHFRDKNELFQRVSVFANPNKVKCLMINANFDVNFNVEPKWNFVFKREIDRFYSKLLA